MPSHAKGGLEDREEALRLLRRIEALHLPFSYAGWLMRVLGPIIQVMALPMFYVWHDEPLGCSVAP
jgi:hypothetical protein